MDFNQIRRRGNDKTNSGKSVKLVIIVLAAVIFVQCLTIVVLYGANKRSKAMYEESLKTQQNMQKTINALTEEESVSDER